MSPNDPIAPRSPTTLAVGARHACFRCRTRAIEPTPCQRCGGRRTDLGTPEGERALSALARRVAFQRALGTPLANRSPGYRAFAHFTAAASAGAAAMLAAKIKTAGYVSPAIVAAAGGLLGILGGYLLAAALSVFAWVALMVLGTLVATVAVLCALVARGVSALLGKERGATLRERTRAQLRRALFLAYAPARWLRGERVIGSDDPDVVTLLRAPDEPSHTSDAPAVLTGVLFAEGDAPSLGADLRAPIVGARGTTLGAGLADALVGALRVRAEDGTLWTIELAAGSVTLPDTGRAVWLGESSPRAWGVPARPGTYAQRKAYPPPGIVDVFTIPAGARVEVSGGDALADATTLRGTPERPLSLRVLEVSSAP